MPNVRESFLSIIDNFTLKITLAYALGIPIKFLMWLYGDDIEIVGVLTLLIVIDTIAGAYKAYLKSDLSSALFKKSFTKIFLYSLLVTTGRLIDKAVPLVFAPMVIETFIAVTEGLSIIENTAEAGLPVPKRFVRRLKSIQKEQ